MPEIEDTSIASQDPSVSPAQQAPEASQASEAPEAAPAPVAAPTADLDNDGHDDQTGQFVAGNDEASNVAEAERNLIAAAEALLAAGAAYASIPETSVFFVGDNYRISFCGHELLTLSRG
jgi:hypothetical protein